MNNKATINGIFSQWRGHALVRLLFFYHFLPILVLVVLLSIKTSLEFAFNIATTDDKRISKVFFFIFISSGLVFSTSVFFDLLFDLLAIEPFQHPQLRKRIKQLYYPENVKSNWNYYSDIIVSLLPTIVVVTIFSISFYYYHKLDCQLCLLSEIEWCRLSFVVNVTGVMMFGQYCFFLLAFFTQNEANESNEMKREKEGGRGEGRGEGMTLMKRISVLREVALGDEDNWEYLMRTTKYGANMLNFLILPLFLHYSSFGFAEAFGNWLLICATESLFYGILWYLLQYYVFVINMGKKWVSEASVIHFIVIGMLSAIVFAFLHLRNWIVFCLICNSTFFIFKVFQKIYKKFPSLRIFTSSSSSSFKKKHTRSKSKSAIAKRKFRNYLNVSFTFLSFIAIFIIVLGVTQPYWYGNIGNLGNPYSVSSYQPSSPLFNGDTPFQPETHLDNKKDSHNHNHNHHHNHNHQNDNNNDNIKDNNDNQKDYNNINNENTKINNKNNNVNNKNKNNDNSYNNSNENNKNEKEKEIREFSIKWATYGKEISRTDIKFILKNNTFPNDHSNDLPNTDTSRIEDNPICKLGPYGISMIDYALMSQLAYFKPDSKDFKTIHNAFFSEYTVRKVEGRAFFFELYSKSKNLVIISIRGTNYFELMDWIQCIDIYLESFGFQILSNFIPGLSFWSKPIITDIINFLSLLEEMLPFEKNERYFYLSISDYVQKLKDSGKKVAVVGHSLGGGLSCIVGSRCRVPAVSISGPGCAYIRKKVGIEKDEDISNNVISFIPSHDFVPMVDSHFNLAYSFPCTSKRPDLCHMPTQLFCHLVSKCNHPSFDFQDCSFKSLPFY